jgi:hypothetical protein
MKKILLGFFLCLLGVLAQAQGLKGIIVEKYYISDSTDAANSVNPLPIGSITYRIYVDMVKSYQFQSVYGSATHTLKINTTTKFFNADLGAVSPTFSAVNAKKNTTMIDSWISTGTACTGFWGVMKSDDDGANNFVNANNPKLLQNADTSAGIALTVKDGMLAGTNLPSFNTYGINTSVINDGTANGNSLTTNSGFWTCLEGDTAFSTTSNKILIAQITTNGVLSFELNVSLRSPKGVQERYVAKSPMLQDGIQEVLNSGLSYNGVAVSGVTLNPTTLSMNVGDKKQVSATVAPSTASNLAVTWKSSDNTVATVSSKGLVTGVKAGTATITALSADSVKSATCAVTVGSVAVNEVITQRMSIYPNPATSIINIKNAPELSTVKVYDIIGHVKALTITNNGSVDVSGLSNGIYYLEVSSKSGKSTFMFVKK